MLIERATEHIQRVLRWGVFAMSSTLLAGDQCLDVPCLVVSRPVALLYFFVIADVAIATSRFGAWFGLLHVSVPAVVIRYPYRIRLQNNIAVMAFGTHR